MMTPHGDPKQTNHQTCSPLIPHKTQERTITPFILSLQEIREIMI